MCQFICTTINYAYEEAEKATIGAWDQIKPVVNQVKSTIYSGYLFAGRKVEWLTNEHLPKPLSNLFAETVWGLPYTLAATILPGYAFEMISGAVLGIWESYPQSFDSTIGQDDRKRIFAGIRNASIIRVGLDVASLLVTRKWSLLLPIIINLSMAIQCHTGARTTNPTPQAAI